MPVPVGDNDVVVRADSRINLITFCIGVDTQIKNEADSLCKLLLQLGEDAKTLVWRCDKSM